MTTAEAKKVLQDAGYFTDNLWRVEDVTDTFMCTDEQAMMVLERVLTDPWIMQKIHEGIIEIACLSYDRKEDE